MLVAKLSMLNSRFDVMSRRRVFVVSPRNGCWVEEVTDARIVCEGCGRMEASIEEGSGGMVFGVPGKGWEGGGGMRESHACRSVRSL